MDKKEKQFINVTRNLAIRRLAQQYQDKRNDEGHARITEMCVNILLKTEDGDREVVIPAIILHDVGWSRIPEERRMSVFDPSLSPDMKRDIRVEHQDYSVQIAKEILCEVNYSDELTKEILEIISQHDTREGFISQNEGLVRDGDKLWRYTDIGIEADMARTGMSFQEMCNTLENNIDKEGFFYSERARQIAREALAERKAEYF